MIENQTNKISKWRELWGFFKQRTKSPFQHPEYVFYFLVVIIGFGAIGIWTALYTESSNSAYSHLNVINNLVSYAVAIIATGSIELVFIQNKIIKHTIFIISIGILAFSGLIFFFSINNNNIYAYWLAIPFSLFALFVWWIANAENANLTIDFWDKQSNSSKKLNKSLEDYEK